MYYFSSLLKDPCLRWYAETYNYRPGGILGVALTDPSIKSQPPDSLPTARCFPYVGLVLSHTDLVDHENDIALSFRSSFLATTFPAQEVSTSISPVTSRKALP